MPARMLPTPHPYASALASAFPDGSWWMATSDGTPEPPTNTSRIRWPGALGAIIDTSTSGGGTISL